jgi:hypothetical protein
MPLSLRVTPHPMPACVTVTPATALLEPSRSVTVPVREFTSELGCVVTYRTPAPVVTPIHGSAAAAVHVHDVCDALTVTASVDPAACGVSRVGESTKLQLVPNWVTVNVLPATAMVPTRGVGAALLLSTLKPTVALPVPEGVVTWSHDVEAESEVAVQSQVLPAVSEKLPL